MIGPRANTNVRRSAGHPCRCREAAALARVRGRERARSPCPFFGLSTVSAKGTGTLTSTGPSENRPAGAQKEADPPFGLEQRVSGSPVSVSVSGCRLPGLCAAFKIHGVRKSARASFVVQMDDTRGSGRARRSCAATSGVTKTPGLRRASWVIPELRNAPPGAPRAEMAEWQTQRIQNPPTKNRAGSTPALGTPPPTEPA